MGRLARQFYAKGELSSERIANLKVLVFEWKLKNHNEKP